MLIKTDGSKQTNHIIESFIGKQLNVRERLSNKLTGSGLYNMRMLVSKNAEAINLPKENARCNFEIYKAGVLLRINDNQELFGIPLSIENTLEIKMFKGDEKIAFNTMTSMLHSCGVSKETLKDNWFLSGGFYSDPFQLLIRTDSEVILLEGHGSIFKQEKEFWENNVLFTKMVIHE